MSFAIQSFTGKVVKKEIKRGTVNAIMTKDGIELVLRQEGKSGLEPSILDSLVGKTITANGSVDSYVLVVHNFKEEPEGT